MRLWAEMYFHSQHCPASTSCSNCLMSSSTSCSHLKAIRSNRLREAAAPTRKFRLPAYCCSPKLLLLPLEVALVSLVLVLYTACSSTNFVSASCSAFPAVCVPPAALAGNVITVPLRASLSDLSLPMRKCCFSSRSLTPSTNAWAASL